MKEWYLDSERILGLIAGIAICMPLLIGIIWSQIEFRRDKKKWSKKKECPQCEGSGSSYHRQSVGISAGYSICNKCNGSGIIKDKKEKDGYYHIYCKRRIK